MAIGTKKTKEVKNLTYAQLITKSVVDLEKEQIELEIEKAENVLEQGILSIKGDMLNRESLVKAAKFEVINKEKILENAIASRPFSVQTIINARVQVLMSENNAADLQAEFEEIKGHYDYLVELQTRLF